jgi:hypothetical protein
MFHRWNLRLVAVSALAMATISLPVLAASELAAATTEFSAQSKEDLKNKKAAPKNVAPTQAPVHVAPRQAPVRVVPRQAAPRVIERHMTPQGGAQKKLNTQNKNAPVIVVPRSGSPSSGAPKTARKVFTPRGANSRIVSAARIRGVPMRGAGRTTIGGRNYSVWRSGYRLRRGDHWRTFVALGTLSSLMIGSAEYYPYAYIDAPADYCDGLTEDGCQLVYDEVETLEGDAVGQCVAYCPWQ